MTRKYRNLKGNSQPKRILKYSEEWIQYRKLRGADSIKVAHCDTDDDGHFDAIVRAWRHPALKKSQICQTTPSNPSNPLLPAFGPDNVEAVLTVVAPAFGPDNVEAVLTVVAPTSGPTELTAVEKVAAPAQGDILTNTLDTGVDLDMLYVEPGTFTMGSPTTETDTYGLWYGETQRQVTLTKGFYLGKYEVTQAQYEAVMTGNTDWSSNYGSPLSTTPSAWPNNPNRPVDQVSHNDAQIFLTRLNAQQSANIPTGWAYVLPTDAQWEYACRAGTTTAFSWGNTVAVSNANYDASGINQTRDVGQYAANPWGFHDMHGNVWEFCADWYANLTSDSVTDPTGPASGSHRVERGGAYTNVSGAMRSARRLSTTRPFDRYDNLGFRVALTQI